MGVTAQGVNREFSTSLECAYLCRKRNDCKPLGIPETAFLQLAKRLPRKASQANHGQLLFKGVTPSYTECRPPWKTIAKGILPSLRHVVNQGSKIGCKEECVPESQFNPLTRPIDPFGNDYTCVICNRELANTYFRCEGCQELLLKDYNICDECFAEDRFKCYTPQNDDKLLDWASNFHHIGKVPMKTCEPCRRKRRIPKCVICKECTWCECRCHWNFTKHTRFFNQKALIEFKVNCEALVGDDEVQFAKETEWRLRNRR